MLTIMLVLLASSTFHYGRAEIFGALDPGWDLASYISRPEFRSPLMEVTIHDADAISPGYWFLAPYASLIQGDMGREYAPYQAGPYIYDNQGHLVWNGAYISSNRNSFDFRLSMYGTSPVLTFVIDGKSSSSFFPDGAGIVLDTSYSLRANVAIRKPGERLNFHEFNLVDGRTSLSAIEKPMVVDISYIGIEPKTAYIANYGFREIDITSGKILFEWFPAPSHVALPESMIAPPFDLGRNTEPWDCFHLNSVEKNSDGDYLISMRYTSTIYKISGTSGGILWRLGGKFSNFIQDFNFSSQHDAKFYSYNESVTIISFLDNASDEAHRQPWTADASNIKLVALYEHESPMRAQLLKSFPCPDGGHTMRRGSAQFLPDGNLFAGWSRQGYMSEFAPDGRTVLEAKFVSTRFDSYRAYKFDFIGRPSERPALKAHAYFGTGNGIESKGNTVFYVSWNGATEVKRWAFYGSMGDDGGVAGRRIAITPDEEETPRTFKKLGEVARAGFETTFMVEGVWKYSYAVAYSGFGEKLGTSVAGVVVLPNLGLNVTAPVAGPGLGVKVGDLVQIQTETQTETVKEIQKQTETIKKVETQTETQTIKEVETHIQTQIQTLKEVQTETLLVHETETIVSTQRVKETQAAVPPTLADDEKVVVLHTSRPILIAAAIVALALVLSSIVSVSLLLYKRFGGRGGLARRRGSGKGRYKAVSSGRGEGDDEGSAFEFDLKGGPEGEESEDEEDREDRMPEAHTSPRKYGGERGRGGYGHGRTTSVDIDGEGGGRERGRGGGAFGGPLTPS